MKTILCLIIFAFIVVPCADARFDEHKAIEDSLSQLLEDFQGALDNLTGSIKTVDYAHHENHEGWHFRAHKDTTLGDGDSLFVYFAPSTDARFPHLVFEAGGSFIISAHFYEAPTLTDSSAVFTPINTNRQSANLSSKTLYYDVVATNFGTILDGAAFGGATGSAGKIYFGGEGRSDHEWIFKQNTGYLLVIVSGTASNLVNVGLSWYEE